MNCVIKKLNADAVRYFFYSWTIPLRNGLPPTVVSVETTEEFNLNPIFNFTSFPSIFKSAAPDQTDPEGAV